MAHSASGQLSWWGVALIVGASQVARADRQEPAMFNGVGIQSDDDAYNLFHHTDENYTAGGFLSFSGRWVDAAHLTAPIDGFDWLFQTRRMYEWMDRASPTIARGYDFTFATTLYTPADLRLAAPIHDDHPYASLESLFVSHTSCSDTMRLIPGLPGGLALSSDFTLGILGLNLGNILQSWVHLLLRNGLQEPCNPNSRGPSPPQPCGWKNQISNGGEPTFLYAVHMQQLLIGRELAPFLWFDAKLTGDASLGYQIIVAPGAEVRLGLISTPFWMSVVPPITLGPDSGPLPQHRLPYGIELYLWAAVQGQVVAYDALLEGQFRYSAVRVQAQPLVAAFQAGLMFDIWCLRLSWVPFVGRTADFVRDAEGTHLWTELAISAHGNW